MKNLILAFLLSPIFFSQAEKTSEQKTNPEVIKEIDVDGDKFKNDVVESVLFFLKEANLNPDSCYVPFREK